MRNKKTCIYSDAVRASTQGSDQPLGGYGETTATARQVCLDQPGEADVRTQPSPASFPATETRDFPGLASGSSLTTSTDTELPNEAVNINYTSPVDYNNRLLDDPVNVATARWLGMLAKDAEVELETTLNDSTALSTATCKYPIDSSPQRNGLGSDDNTVFANIPSIPDTNADDQDQRAAEESLWRNPSPLTINQQEQSIFELFVTDVSQWIDLFDPQRHFSTLVPRLALYNVGLLNAILALTIRRVSLVPEIFDAYSLRREDALHYYHETLQYVAEAMQYRSYHTSLELLATALIVSTYEMLDGSPRDWERHLQGVFWIQRSQLVHGDSEGLRGANWWAWLCQDVWAAFRAKRKVISIWNPERALSELTPVQLAARSVFLLGRVINYCSRAEHDNTQDNITSSLRAAETLTAMLDEWQRLRTPEFAPLPQSEQPKSTVFQPVWIHPPIFAVSVQVHHAARILIALNRPALGGINQAMERQASLDGHVNVICGIALKLSDYASSTMSSQCLFIGELCDPLLLPLLITNMFSRSRPLHS